MMATTPTPSTTETTTTTERFLDGDPFVGLLLPDAVDVERCAELRAALDERGFDATGERYPRSYRNNDRLVFDDPVLAASLFTALRERLPDEHVVDGTRWTLHGLNTRFRACRYRDGQAFCVHRDGPHVPADDLRSHLTLQLYLDDVPAGAGGRTRFYVDAAGSVVLAAIAPRRGAVIVFDHRAWHDGEAVTTGVKHVLRTDVMFRRTGEPAPDLDVVGRHRGYAWRVVVCRDGTLASSGRDGTIRRWGPAPRTYALGAGSVTTLVEDTRGRLWAGTRSGVLAREAEHRFTHAAAEVGAVLGGCAWPGRDGGVVFATSRGTLVGVDGDGRVDQAIAAHRGWAWTVSAYGDALLSCGEDGRVALHDGRAQPRTLAELPHGLRALAVIGRDILVGDTRGWLFRLGADGEVIASRRAHAAAITAVAVGPDGDWVTSSEDGRIIRWRAGQPSATTTAPDFVTSVAVDRAGVIACAGYDGAIWRVR
jgi:hypothetical protein